jgi:UDP-N-acetylmuramoyl-L-alanyl-D-glutamate--2,6-diaminopimelate ligase
MTIPTRPTHVAPVALATLAALVQSGPSEATHEGVFVTGVSLRSSSVRPGDLYAALPGAHVHGADFAAQARSAGAVAVLTDPDGAARARLTGLPTVVVPDPRRVLGSVAAAAYGHPAEALRLIGVTGTQGKTTTTQLLARSLAAAGRRTAVIGTLGTEIDGETVKTALTTPEAPDLHAMFAVMRERGVDVCAMEVSSHALVLGRVDGLTYDVAAFVNFGRDHLDFHGDLEHYFAAKASLLTPQRARHALLNVDDPAVATLRRRLEIPVTTYSASGQAADWVAERVRLGRDGAHFELRGPRGLSIEVSTRLTGDFNVANALACLAAAAEAGCDVMATAAGLSTVEGVRGRLERVDVGQPFEVVVDYAHKPDALAAVLHALRPVTPGRLWVVLGAGGDRDQGKRGLMGAAAARLADVVVVTDDNPRTENPAKIRAALLAGARGAAATEAPHASIVMECAGRREAIEHALGRAAAGDTVLVAGKGHETGQEIAGRVVEFDDRAVVRDILSGRLATGRAS